MIISTKLKSLVMLLMIELAHNRTERRAIILIAQDQIYLDKKKILLFTLVKDNLSSKKGQDSII